MMVCFLIGYGAAHTRRGVLMQRNTLEEAIAKIRWEVYAGEPLEVGEQAWPMEFCPWFPEQHELFRHWFYPVFHSSCLVAIILTEPAL